MSTDIPCLLSKGAMKRAKIKIDTEHDMVEIYGQRTRWINGESGHYYIQIQDYIKKQKELQESIILINDLEEAKDDDELMKRMKRMHATLGHPGRRVFETMIKNSNMKNCDVRILNKLYETCESCLSHKSSKAKHKVSPPMAHDFNETICMDLKIWHGTGKIILYTVDMFSRLTQAQVIRDKRPESVLKVLVDQWIKRWGAPQQILVDNGTEFVNEKMMKV